MGRIKGQTVLTLTLRQRISLAEYTQLHYVERKKSDQAFALDASKDLGFEINKDHVRKIRIEFEIEPYRVALIRERAAIKAAKVAEREAKERAVLAHRAQQLAVQQGKTNPEPAGLIHIVRELREMVLTQAAVVSDLRRRLETVERFEFPLVDSKTAAVGPNH
jgi:hypothetical protein